MKTFYINPRLDKESYLFFCNGEIEIFSQYRNKLKVTKEFIDKCRDKWDNAKKQTNEYEYIYTSTNPSKNICAKIPISRSYFKLREILYDLNIFIDDKIACIAEAPGGFIQCLLDMTDHNKIYGITLVSDNKDIPYWNNSLLKHKRVYLSNGDDNTGDLYNPKNLLHFLNEAEKNSCSLVTADGGFDYSDDFNSQEYLSYKLIFSEVFLALSLLKKNGTFICKIFDIFTIHTVNILYLLYTSFEEIILIKPVTSRLTNSEKYVVCKGFKGYDKDKSNLLFSLILNDNIYDFTLNIPQSFIDELSRYNEKFTNSQISMIQKSIYCARSRNVSYTANYKQVKKGKEWCRKYDLPINEIYI